MEWLMCHGNTSAKLLMNCFDDHLRGMNILSHLFQKSREHSLCQIVANFHGTIASDGPVGR